MQSSATPRVTDTSPARTRAAIDDSVGQSATGADREIPIDAVVRASRGHETVVAASADQALATTRARGDRVHAGIDHEDAATFVAGEAVAMLTAWLREEEPSAPEHLVARLLLLPMPEWLVGTA